ncbi:hypothetical protein D7003_06375 [Arthrobacter oryzae]|uniref:Uncharacterized protein n=1 Tax=Arthrobacter oryzae TaxID=409290 RepID=A0A3N0C4G4_9MICC|nr:hypothetical protein D7003_06375 [Arthrobacter oryzae]
MTFQVAGVNGVPADATAVVLNLTVTGPASESADISFGFVTAHAAGSAKPNASNLNYAAGQTISNLAVVPVGTGGKVTLSNTSGQGSVSLIADIQGYYQGGEPASPGAFKSMAPARFLDTRTSAKVGPGQSVSFQAGGAGGVPADAKAVVMNLTVTEPSKFGFVTAYPAGSDKPNASNLNYAQDETVPNLAVVPVGADGKVTLTNSSTGSVQLIADISGYFLAGTAEDNGAFEALAPTRFLDTRLSSGPVAGNGTVSFQVAGVHGVPANVAGIWVNLTATETGADGFLTGFASGATTPATPNVSYGWTRTTAPNLAYLPVGDDGKVTVENTSSGSAQVIADVSGYVLK